MARFSVEGLLRLISQGVSWAVFFLEALGENLLPSSFWLLAWLSSCGCNDILVSLLVVSRKPLSGPASSPHSLPLSSSVFKASSGESPSLPPLSPSHASMEKAMAPHSSTLAWKILWTEEPGRLQSMGSLRVGHDWATYLSLFTFIHWRRKWQPTPVFLPGESQRRGSLVGCRLWGHTESDTTEVT